MNITKDIKARNVLKVALYVRVSSLEQVEGYSISEQTERLKKYAEAMGWEVYKVYVDPGYSGGNTNRPGLNALIRDVEDGLIDKVVVYKLDRLSRSQFDTLYLIEKVFLANNTDFVSMTENFSTASALGRAMIGFLAVFAQLEKDKINERSKMGKDARARSGKWHGGSTQPIGYDYDPNTELLNINDYEVMQILELAELFLAGTPLRAIEKIFKEKGYKHKHGVWDPKTMRRVLRNKLYIGLLKHCDEWYPGLHSRIFTDETFDKIQKLLDDRAEKYKTLGIKPGAQTTYLGGLLYCKHCGGKYAKQENSRRVPGKDLVYWYMCYSRCKKVRRMIKDPNCKNKNWKMIELDNLVFEEIRKLALDPRYLDDIKEKKETSNEEPNKIDILKKEIQKIDEQISRFMDLYGIGKFTIDQVSSKVDPLNEQKRNLERELNNIYDEMGAISEEEAFEIIRNFDEILETEDYNEIRLAIETLIHYIEIDNEDIYIHWKFI